MAVPFFMTACGDSDDTEKTPGPGQDQEQIEQIDYAGQLTLKLDSETKKQEVTVRQLVDGDTTHFNPVKNSKLTGYNPADFASTQGFIKARYLAINTPESTGKIEKWGKAASNFTESKLDKAYSIIVESDDDKWNIDSTGERYTLWIWYKSTADAEYRNLNIEILQNGYAVASNTGATRYGEIGLKAIAQARALQLNVHAPASVEDPLFHDSDATHLSLKELRCHAADYVQYPVRVEGTVVAKFGGSAYIEDYDPETGRYFGIQIFYGYPKDGTVKALSVGNRVSVYGKVTEHNGGYQLTDVSKNEITPHPDTDIEILGTGKGSFVDTKVDDIMNGTVSIDFVTDEGKDTIELDYGEAVMSTTVTLKNLRVMEMYTTSNGGQSDGAISITCEDEYGDEIVVRTEVLYDDKGELVTEEMFEGKTITVKGLIGQYNGVYQVICWRIDYITIVD